MKETRFWELVDKSQVCWVWQGTKDRRGYGRIVMHHDGLRIQLAHRAAFLLWYGIYPIDLHHTCQTPSCVNPMHLAPIGRAANARIQQWPERCPQGHEFDGSYRNKKGYRVRMCTLCIRESQRRYNAKPETKHSKREWAARRRAEQLAS